MVFSFAFLVFSYFYSEFLFLSFSIGHNIFHYVLFPIASSGIIPRYQKLLILSSICVLIFLKKNLMKVIATNKKAFRDYDLFDKFEAGLVLTGTEVKSLRAGRANISDAFVRIEGGEAYIFNMHIPEYKFGNIFNHEPDRKRKLLLHKREIDKISGSITRKHYTCVPLRLYFKDGWAKVEIALAKGRRQHDKRDAIKKREVDRQIRRALKR